MPNKNFDEKALELKNFLNSQLGDNATKEQIDFTKEANAKVDELIKCNGETQKDYDELKGDYIHLIKSSGAPSKANTDESQPVDLNNSKEFENDLNDFFKDHKI